MTDLDKNVVEAIVGIESSLTDISSRCEDFLHEMHFEKCRELVNVINELAYDPYLHGNAETALYHLNNATKEFTSAIGNLLQAGHHLAQTRLTYESKWKKSKELWRVLIDVFEIDQHNNELAVTVSGRYDDELIRISRDSMPAEVWQNVLVGSRLHAYANIGVDDAEQLIFKDWEMQ